MRPLFFIFLVIILALINATLMNDFMFFGVKPDLLFVVVIILALNLKNKFTIFLSILAGSLKDILGAYPLAINTLLFPVWSLFIMELSKKFSLESELIQILCAFVVIFLNDIISRLIFLFLGYPIGLGIFFRIALLESMYTALILPLIIKITKSLIPQR